MRPSRTRYGVIGFSILLAIITYIDRVCIGQSKSDIIKDLHLEDTDMGWVFWSFSIAYALFEIPSGWLGDKLGPRRVLCRVVLWWSAFTAATGYAWNLASMVICRFLFGAGEAGAFPNITKMFTLWLPQRERNLAQGIVWLSARWGGAFTPFLVAAILKYISWRHAFLMFGGLGVIWTIAFYRWFRDHPRDHPKVNEAEQQLIGDTSDGIDSHASVPWSLLLRTRSVLLLWVYYFCISYSWYFYVSWLPTYMEKALQLDPKSTYGALACGLPLFLGGIGCYVGGWLANKLCAPMNGLGASRRAVALVGMVGAGVLLAVSLLMKNPWMTMVAMGLSGFFNDLSMPPAWGACMDIGGRNAGSVSGSMNMVGNFGGALGQLIAPYLVKWFSDNWNVPLWVAAASYLISIACWLFIDPLTPMEEQAKRR